MVVDSGDVSGSGGSEGDMFCLYLITNSPMAARSARVSSSSDADPNSLVLARINSGISSRIMSRTVAPVVRVGGLGGPLAEDVFHGESSQW